jgi:hypothetical protein
MKAKSTSTDYVKYFECFFQHGEHEEDERRDTWRASFGVKKRKPAESIKLSLTQVKEILSIISFER